MDGADERPKGTPPPLPPGVSRPRRSEPPVEEPAVLSNALGGPPPESAPPETGLGGPDETEQPHAEGPDAVQPDEEQPDAPQEALPEPPDAPQHAQPEQPGAPQEALPEPPLGAAQPVPGMAPPGPAASHRRAWLWLLIPLVAVGSWIAELRIEASIPPASSWAAAVELLGRSLEPGDAVWVNPTWAAASWTDLESAAVERGLERGRFILHASPLTAVDVARFKHVYIVGEPAGSLPSNLSPPETLLEAPALVVQRADVTAPVATDFRAALPDATVDRVGAEGGRIPCRWSGDRHTCDGRWWTAVRERMSEVGFTRRSCIWAHAFPDHGVLRVRYPGATLGKVLTGGVGLTLWTVRQDNGSPVVFRALIDGEPVWETTMPRGDFAWHEMAVDTSGRSGQTADVTFEVSADSTYWRRVCFDAVAY